MVYLYDIVVYSTDLQTHEEHLTRVLEKLKKYLFYAKLLNCSITVTKLFFDGHRVTNYDVQLHHSKNGAEEEIKVYQTVTEVRNFFGHVSYHRNFNQHFAVMARPLHDLICKDKVWE